MSPQIDTSLAGFTRLLENYDRPGAVAFALDLLERAELTVPQLYEQVLAPSLNRIQVPREQEDSLIWREHMMSAIVRTVVESAQPYVLQSRETGDRQGKGQKVLLACPEEEYHDLGIRMGADYFAILGFEVAYVGNNTPLDTLIDAANTLKPGIVALGVTNYLNLAQLPAVVSALKAALLGVKVWVSGSALRHTGKTADAFGADGAIDTFASLKALVEGKA